MLGAALTGALPASATDGVAEINQTCATQTGCFAGDSAGFPVTITTSGSYRLTSNLILPNENTNGIRISFNDVGIDLNNFAILGSVSCIGTPVSCAPSGGTGVGILVTVPEFSGIAVRNGSVRGMGSYGVRLGDQAAVTHVLARWNGSVGIGTGSGSTVSGNTVYGNGQNGIQAFSGSTDSGNTALSNGTNGISAGNGSTVSANTVRLNTGFGLNLGFQAGYRENVISGNTAGLVTGISFVNLGNNACNGITLCP